MEYKKSFARLFDPTTFIDDEQNMSQEDYAEGEEAWKVFSTRIERADRLAEMNKLSPFVKFI